MDDAGSVAGLPPHISRTDEGTQKRALKDTKVHQRKIGLPGIFPNKLTAVGEVTKQTSQKAQVLFREPLRLYILLRGLFTFISLSAVQNMHLLRIHFMYFNSNTTRYK